ncbi:MAG TPA: hypothetical protein PLW01_11215 [Agitococcus sp.]|nr:hypothetical protein [Agitococcus sp.]
MASTLEINESALKALQELCKETRMNPSKVIQEAIIAYRRQRANEKYLGTGSLELNNDHPSEIKQAIKKSLKDKHGYSA